MTRTIAHKRLVVGEKKQRFGFRKTILGLCGAILGSTLLMVNVANNANTVHAAESDPGQAGQPLAKKDVSQLDSSLKQDEKAGADKNQGADKGATGTGADKSGSQLGSQTGAQGTGTGADTGAQGDKSADVAGKYVPNQNQVTTHSKNTHSKVTGKTDSTSASSSSATKADSANATSTNEYSASASNLSKTGAASTSNSTAVKTNAKYANSVETVDNNKRGNRENINQRRIVKRSAVVPSASEITITTEKKTVNETVSYVDQNGHVVLAKPHTASVDFTRQVSTDAVTGEKTYGHWSAAQSFDAVTSPELKGYTADKAQIDKQTVTGDSKDLEFTVTYTKKA
ncbi:mucin-binding protein, partial [Lactobacillus helveticus]|uniref:mucin-binding protein n=1 Tax=Lactobacillus helveticus TaxID=1587 RepID=UPI001D0F9B39